MMIEKLCQLQLTSKITTHAKVKAINTQRFDSQKMDRFEFALALRYFSDRCSQKDLPRSTPFISSYSLNVLLCVF